VVDHDRELAVRPDDVAEEVGHDLLVGHGKDHVAPRAILEARHLGPDRVVPAGLAPELRRVHDRHLHLLAADPVHLLADHLFHPLRDPEAERQQRVDPRSQLADVAGPDQQAMRWHLRVVGIVAERGEEQATQAHGPSIAAGTAAEPGGGGAADGQPDSKGAILAGDARPTRANQP